MESREVRHHPVVTMRLLSRVSAVLVLCSPAAVRAEDAVSYNRDVRPILSDRCFACHGFDAKNRESGLRLDQRDAALSGGDSGEPAIVPGAPAASLVIDRITSKDPDVIMPPPSLHKPLSAADVSVLTRWIAQGAPYEPHWAFIQPKLPEIPAVENEGWPRNTIDRFVLAKLEAAGLSASPEADRRTLIRRVSLDLTGLPPSPEEVRAFVEDEAPDAYDKLVDRLLASPHCAERLAMPWLDAARYADSNGYQFDNDRWAWPWRDWLIRQIDSGRPFNEVIVEMLAGDLLDKPTQEQVLATSFNRNHFVNAEGGAIAEEVRFTYVLDRIETTSTTFLGLTFACAQCHDHKYDPVSQKTSINCSPFWAKWTRPARTVEGSIRGIFVFLQPSRRCRWPRRNKKRSLPNSARRKPRRTKPLAARRLKRRSAPSPARGLQA